MSGPLLLKDSEWKLFTGPGQRQLWVGMPSRWRPRFPGFVTEPDHRKYRIHHPPRMPNYTDQTDHCSRLATPAAAGRLVEAAGADPDSWGSTLSPGRQQRLRRSRSPPRVPRLH